MEVKNPKDLLQIKNLGKSLSLLKIGRIVYANFIMKAVAFESSWLQLKKRPSRLTRPGGGALLGSSREGAACPQIAQPALPTSSGLAVAACGPFVVKDHCAKWLLSSLLLSAVLLSREATAKGCAM